MTEMIGQIPQTRQRKVMKKCGGNVKCVGMNGRRQLVTDHRDMVAQNVQNKSVWQDGKYMIARDRSDVKTDRLERRTIPAGTYAAFRTERGGVAWKEFPKLFELIFGSWLPSSDYRQKGDLAIEVLHLWTDHDLRQKNRYYEVWIPVEVKEAT